MKKCLPMKKQADGLFGFSKGCLPMERWDDLNDLFNKTSYVIIKTSLKIYTKNRLNQCGFFFFSFRCSARITFGLNALMGKTPAKDGSINWVGDWDPRNARDFIRYTASKGYKIDSYELGNGQNLNFLNSGKILSLLTKTFGSKKQEMSCVLMEFLQGLSLTNMPKISLS